MANRLHGSTSRLRLCLEITVESLLVLLLVTNVATVAQAQTLTFTVLHSFASGADGAYPSGALIIDAAGNLYGTTGAGGVSTNCPGGCGTVFKLDASANITVLHSFSGTDGAHPAAGLIMDSSANLIGTTEDGGSGGACSFGGCGAVFKLDPSGNETLLYAFTGGSDGRNPEAGVIRDAAGDLYGTTSHGGNTGLCDARCQLFGPNPPCVFGCGVVFRLDAAGNETVLYAFLGGAFGIPDGAVPYATLIMDAVGNLYGTTVAGWEPERNEPGGVLNGCNFDGVAGCGSVFKVDSSGRETPLVAFFPASSPPVYPIGAFPFGSLVMDASGNLYGTTSQGGASGYGTVFKRDSSGNYTVLHSFAGSPGDGADPFSGVSLDAAGNLYGTTLQGGASGFGTVFKIDSSGNETILHSFTGIDGSLPAAGLLTDAAGNLYGTAFQGGASGYGTVFELAAQTPQQATQSIINSVNVLVSLGALSGGQGNSLVVKLQHAISLMNVGNTTATNASLTVQQSTSTGNSVNNLAAIGNLNAFIGEVNALLSSGVLVESQAAPLLSAAKSVIERLS